MLISFVELRNFRKLRSCRIDFSEKETVFVGANNSGKTSAMDALILFLKEKSKISSKDFTLSNWKDINDIGKSWVNLKEDAQPNLSIENWKEFLPQLDVWIKVDKNEIHYINELIPTLDWAGGMLGVRLRFEPKNIETLYKDFIDSYNSAKNVTLMAENGGKKKITLNLWPKSLWDFLERRLQNHFTVSSYVLDSEKLVEPISGFAQPQELSLDNLPISNDPFKGLIKIDIINAQRGFSDPNGDGEERQRLSGNLSLQLREYYARHLNPYDQPSVADLEALQAMEDAKASFDEKLSGSFNPSLKELENLNYPGFGGNPSIKISSRINAIDGLNHASAVQFELFKSIDGNGDFPLSLPERYNGLGYQNLISMVFKLIRFRDEWMQVGKKMTSTTDENEDAEFQPLHLVLVEEPEAHLHAQVQQVFIKKAYEVLRTNDLLLKHQHFKTQLIVSTHSNHIAHEISFTSLRYFKRQRAEKEKVPTSTVVNLSKTFGSENDTTKFAIRYLKSTHCDLFFADAVILVEGPTERMLVPHFIKHFHSELSTCYIALLEIGGSHSHTLRPLLQDLGITTLIITDIDSIQSQSDRVSVLPENNKNYISGNNTLTGWLPGKTSLDDLLSADSEAKISAQYPFRVAYQAPIMVKLAQDKQDVQIAPYTFEIALAFKNVTLFKNLQGKGLLKKISDAVNLPTANEANINMYQSLKNGKKAEFALELLFLEEPTQLKVPDYIAEGLNWLLEKLNCNPEKIH